MTPREFVASRESEVRKDGVLWHSRFVDDQHISLAEAPQDVGPDQVVVVVHEDDWDVEVPTEVRGVWAPTMPVVDNNQYLVVTRAVHFPRYGRPECNVLYAAAQQVFMSLPPATHWQGTLSDQIAAIRAWVELWEGDFFFGPYWTVSRGGHWILTSETSGRTFELSPRFFIVDFRSANVYGHSGCDGSIVAACDVLSRLLDANPSTNEVGDLTTYVAVGYTDEQGSTRIVEGSEFVWPATLRQLVAALRLSASTRDQLRYPNANTNANSNGSDDELIVIVPEFDLDIE